MNKAKNLNKKKAQRIGRVRALISGTATRPRLVVQRSNRYFYAQLIDDVKGATLLSISNLGSKKTASKLTGKKSEQASVLGETLAKKAAEKGITKAVFDRRSYQFHGRVESFVEAAKKAGLKI